MFTSQPFFPLALCDAARTPLTPVLDIMYRVVQLNLTPEIKVSYMLFDRSLSIFTVTSLKQDIEYNGARL